MIKKKILIIDDEEDFLELLEMNLKSAKSYEIRTESKASQAVTVANEFKPDLILLDIAMPEVDGGEVASRMKRDSSLKNIPIIFLTALIDPEEVGSQGEDVRRQNFLAKPVDKKELIERIEEILQDKQ